MAEHSSATQRSAGALLDMAERALNSGPDGRWKRASAILARQAIEQTSMQALALRGHDTSQRVSFRAAFIALAVVHDRSVVVNARSAWSTLSEFCHHRVYELPPPMSAIRECIEVGRQFADSVAALESNVSER